MAFGHKYQYSALIVSRLILVMRNVLDNDVEKIKTRVLRSVNFFRKICLL
jgi:hypothetical protein